MAEPIFKQSQDGCENEAGCSSDFNTYDSMEKAKAALLRWLGKYDKYGKLVVKVLKP